MENTIPRFAPPQLALFFLLRKHCQRMAQKDFDSRITDMLFTLMQQGGGTLDDVCLSPQEAQELDKQYRFAGGWIGYSEGDYLFMPALKASF